MARRHRSRTASACPSRVPPNRAARMINSPVFFSGIGGSGMLPLASIVRASGARVAGSDRSLDAGRTPPKFDYLRSLGIQLFPQDGSGLQDGDDAGHLGGGRRRRCPTSCAPRSSACPHLTRPEFLAQLLNAAQRSVAVGGTSGKSTVTGMIGWILHACHRQPTVMNGAVMKNFVTPTAPFASALVGDPELFVSEVDESDGSIALYQPEVAVLTNISLDHKEMDELRQLFGAFPRAFAQGRAQPRRSRDPRPFRNRAARQGHRLRLRQSRRRLHGQGSAARRPDGVTLRARGGGRSRTTSASRCPAVTMPRTRSRRSRRRGRSACGLEDAVNALARFEGLRAAARDGRRGWRRHGDRRFRAQPRQDRRDAGDPARAARAAVDHVPAARLSAR